MIVLDSNGARLPGKARLWKGDDASYLSITVLTEEGLPPDIHQRLSVQDDFSAIGHFIVREIIHDMRADQFTVQAIDEKNFLRMSRFVPRPPRFDTVEEADAWLEKYEWNRA